MKVKFYKSFNCLFHKAGRLKDELVTLHLVLSFCRPYLLYATECLGLTATQMCSLRNTWQCAVSHIFNVGGTNVNFICATTDSASLDTVIATKRMKFYRVYKTSTVSIQCCIICMRALVNVSSFGWELWEMIEVWFLPDIDLLFMLCVLVCPFSFILFSLSLYIFCLHSAAVWRIKILYIGRPIHNLRCKLTNWLTVSDKYLALNRL